MFAHVTVQNVGDPFMRLSVSK